MTRERFQEIRKRCGSATPGPWSLDRLTCYIWGPRREMIADDGADEGIRMRGFGAKLPMDANGEFIAHARTDIPDLIDEVERLQGIVAAWETWARENESAINGVCTIAQIHGMPYTGKPWPLKKEKAVTA